MNLYQITISYTAGSSSDTFVTMRRASSPGVAVSAATALFTALSNYRTSAGTPPVYTPWLRITGVSVILVND